MAAHQTRYGVDGIDDDSDGSWALVVFGGGVVLLRHALVACVLDLLAVTAAALSGPCSVVTGVREWCTAAYASSVPPPGGVDSTMRSDQAGLATRMSQIPGWGDDEVVQELRAKALHV
ncbi:hypothetical protein SEVIR_5G151750v4 [Setaria viridis]